MADYNRCGVPLIEIVTEPDFRSIEEVQDFVEKLALRLKYAGVCDAKMEQGSMRVDVNISIMPVGSTEFGTRAELKNLNSLKAIGRAIEYEINRQAEILDNGGTVIRKQDVTTTTTAIQRHYVQKRMHTIIVTSLSRIFLRYSYRTKKLRT